MATSSAPCVRCGAALTPEQRFCPQCGTARTGSAFSNALVAIPMRSWIRGIPPLVTLLGALMPWLVWRIPATFNGAGGGSLSLGSFGLGGWILILLVAAATATALPLPGLARLPGWFPRAWLAVGAACAGVGFAMLAAVSVAVSTIGGLATSFGGTSPVSVGFGAVVFTLGAVAWSAVGGFRRWD